MRTLFQACILLLSLFVNQAWAETTNWQGQVNQMDVKARLTLIANKVSGTIEVQGYSYQVDARNAQQGAQGTLIDANGSSIPLLIYQQGAGLLVNAYTQGQFAEPLSFTLTQVASFVSQQPSPQASTGNLDPALLGVWLYSESYTSNDFAGAYQERVIFYANGTLAIGSAAGAGGSHSHVMSGYGDSATYAWKVKVQASGDRHLFVKEAGQWQLYGRYYIENGRMLVTKADGSREFWRKS